MPTIMKKFLLPLIIMSSLFLVACQNITTEQEKNAAAEQKQEKASASSKVVIQVGDQNQTNPGASTPAATTAAANAVLISGDGFDRTAVSLKVGQTLSLTNTLDRQVNLFTTSTGENSCDPLGATIEIPGNQTQDIQLAKAFQCTIINQENTDQKIVITVE
jgi:hypothetical protein